MAIRRCPIAPFHTKWAFFQDVKLKKTPITHFSHQLPWKKMGNWRCFKFNILKKKPIWCEMEQIGQRQIAIYIFSVGWELEVAVTFDTANVYRDFFRSYHIFL